jgi:Tol biopolymer transport system component
VVYSGGRVFFTRGDTLMAQEFDVDRLALSGDASPAMDVGVSVWDMSPTGTLAYARARPLLSSQLMLVDRTGNALGTLGDTAPYFTIEISPDGSRAAGAIVDVSRTLFGDVWQFDLTGGGRTRLTFDASRTIGRAVWSPDGSRIVFVKAEAGRVDLFERAADGAGEDIRLTTDGVFKIPLSWTTDGRSIVYGVIAAPANTGNDIWILPLDGDRKPRPYLQTRFSELGAQVSRDGRWLAYSSNESGRYEIYVARFADGGAKRQISTDGGIWPRWRADGNEIFWVQGSTVTAATIDARGPAVNVQSIRRLFDVPNLSGADFPYAVTPDGQRILALATAPSTEEVGPTGITVVVNWEPRSAQP